MLVCQFTTIKKMLCLISWSVLYTVLDLQASKLLGQE